MDELNISCLFSQNFEYMVILGKLPVVEREPSIVFLRLQVQVCKSRPKSCKEELKAFACLVTAHMSVGAEIPRGEEN